MRTAVPGALLALALVAAGCSDGGTSKAAGTVPGCGMVPRVSVVGLLGSDIRATAGGSLRALRSKHAVATCRNTVPGRPERYVTLRAEYHPAPVQLPATSCSAGWVYAGTSDKFTPACQQAVKGHGTTQLIVRWQPYVMHVDIGRSDRSWGGDPEVALALSRAAAQQLGVRSARGDG